MIMRPAVAAQAYCSQRTQNAGVRITITDDRATPVTCPAVTTLAPGASVTCSATYVVTQADLNNGSVTNHAIAHAFIGGLQVTSNQAQATVYAASIALSKSASPTTYHSAGEVITYTYIVTNTGHATLTGPVMVHDDRLGTFACGPAADLLSGASVPIASRAFESQNSR